MNTWQYCEGTRSWGRGGRFKSHLVTEEQGMCVLPSEGRFGAEMLAETARVPSFEPVRMSTLRVPGRWGTSVRGMCLEL